MRYWYKKLLKITSEVTGYAPSFYPFILNILKIQYQTILGFWCITNPLALNEKANVNRIGGLVIDGLISNSLKLDVDGLGC